MKPYPMKKNEAGQAFALMVITLMVLLGFTAFAIDGGLALNDRRDSQSRADSASMAGVGAGANWVKTNPFNCASTAMKNAMIQGAISYAAKNGTTITEKNLAVASITNGVSFENCNPATTEVDVHVRLTAESESFFLQVFSNTPLKNTVDSIARLRANTNIGGGYGIVALNEDYTPCNTVDGIGLTGGGDLTVQNSGIYSNGCFFGGGTINVTSDAPNNYYYLGVWHPGGNVNPTPAPAYTRITPINPPQPNCTALYPTVSTWNYNGANNPGRYTANILFHNGDNATMNPGLYCIMGSFKVTAGTLTGAGITIWLPTGAFNTEGGVVTLSAATTATAVNNAIPGMVLYAPPTNTSNFNINGGSTGHYTGTFFAPGASITLNGGSGTMSTQIIGYNVNIAGGGGQTIIYDDSLLFGGAGYIEMKK